MRHPPPSTAFRGPIGSSTEGPIGTARVRHPPTKTAFRVPTEGSTEGPIGTARMRHPPPSKAFRGHIRGLHRRPQWDRPRASSTTQHNVSCLRRELHLKSPWRNSPGGPVAEFARQRLSIFG
eukprot:9482360-Pyramimonas_sp.AAC.1